MPFKEKRSGPIRFPIKRILFWAVLGALASLGALVVRGGRRAHARTTPDLSAKNHTLSLTLHAGITSDGKSSFYFNGQPNAPTFRLSPGDQLKINYVNDLPSKPQEKVAYSSYVVQDAEGVLDDTTEEKAPASLSVEKVVKEKIVKHKKFRRVCAVSGFIVSTALLAVLLTFPSAQAQDKTTGTPDVPPGTILPVRLNESLSSSKSQPGQIITARIMQDVPLANGGKIREGSKVMGHVVAVSSPADGSGNKVSLQFDTLISSGRTIPIRTNLRAVAGFMAVGEAETPTDGPVSAPIATTQVGGDTAYTAGGDVTKGNTLVVGKSVRDGVLDQAHPGSRQGRECRGAVDDNNSPQAMWVFSSDACGTYGLSEIRIAHAGKTQPVGVIVFVSEKGQLKLPGGAGMLLRVQE